MPIQTTTYEPGMNIIQALLWKMIILYPKTKETRKLFPPVGAVWDDIAKVGGKKAPWDILFTEGFEECKNDEGCRAFAPIFITLIIMMVCVSGYSCYNNDRKDRIVTAQEEHNSAPCENI